jgi:hypothetical protein
MELSHSDIREKCLPFIESEIYLPYIDEYNTEKNSEPDESSPHPYALFS